MRQEITIKGGTLLLSIGMTHLLEGISGDSRKELIDHIACESDVIRQVMSQVLTGYTDLGSHGSTGSGEWTGTYPSALDEARRNIRQFAEQATQDRMKALEYMLDHFEKQLVTAGEAQRAAEDKIREMEDDARSRERQFKEFRILFDDINTKYHAALAAQSGMGAP